MNPRITKEIRVQFPVLGVVLILITLPFAIWGQQGDFGIGAFVLGCVVMAAVSFGTEFQNRTLPMLLVQPVPRASLWREKMLVLGAGLLVSALALAMSIALFARRDFTDAWPVLVLVPVSAFCVTPFFTLCTRNTLGGVGGSLCLPMVAVPPVIWLFDKLFVSDRSRTGCGVLLLLVFCGFVCRAGLVYFRSFQVVDSQSMTLALPARFEGFLLRPVQGMLAHFTGPFAVLVKKELRLQQSCFIVAGVAGLVAVLGVFFHSIDSLESNYHVGTAILGAAFGVCLCTIPFVAGAISLGEERSWGMADWHLTLPPSALKQWAAKMAAAFGTSLALGLLLPGGAFLVAMNVFSKDLFMPAGAALLLWVFGYLLLSAVVIYAASLISDPIKCVLVAIGLIILVGTGMVWLGAPLAENLIGWKAAFGETPWVRDVAFLLEVLPRLACAASFAMICLLQWLAFTNYRHRHVSVSRIAIQVVALTAAAILLTSLLYLFCLFMIGFDTTR